MDKEENQKKSWINPKIEIRPAESKGDGMFAAQNIRGGEVLIVWNVEYTNAGEAKIAKSQGKMVMQWDSDLFSVENAGEDPGFFINHSCDPNSWLEDAYTVSAMKPIKKDEEITIDYALFEHEIGKIEIADCRCGAPSCRRQITGGDWQIIKLQKRYKNHFSPLINKKIKERNHSGIGAHPAKSENCPRSTDCYKKRLARFAIKTVAAFCPSRAKK